MIEWKNILEQSPIGWLLEESNPSVRYFVMRDVLGKPEDDQEVMTAKKAIQGSAVVKRILDKQRPQGYWEDRDSPYLPKLKSSYWTIMLLAQLGMDRTEERIARACEFIFQFQRKEGGFTTHSPESASRNYSIRQRALARAQKEKKLPSREEYISSLLFESQTTCLTGNMISALVRMGYAHDPRVKKALTWLVKVQNADGGWLCPYWKAHIRDKHGCFHGTICPMGAFAELPNGNRTEQMRRVVSEGAEFLLAHRLYKADHHDYTIINKFWLELRYPDFGYSILRGLDVLTKLGYVEDERLNDALEVLMQKRRSDGAWVLESSPIGRMQANLEPKGRPSKWITMIALRVLRRLGTRTHETS